MTTRKRTIPVSNDLYDALSKHVDRDQMGDFIESLAMAVLLPKTEYDVLAKSFVEQARKYAQRRELSRIEEAVSRTEEAVASFAQDLDHGSDYTRDSDRVGKLLETLTALTKRLLTLPVDSTSSGSLKGRCDKLVNELDDLINEHELSPPEILKQPVEADIADELRRIQRLADEWRIWLTEEDAPRSQQTRGNMLLGELATIRQWISNMTDSPARDLLTEHHDQILSSVRNAADEYKVTLRRLIDVAGQGDRSRPSR